MPQDAKAPANPFETYSQQERDSMGQQLNALMQSGKLTPGQAANVRKAMLLNNKASQAKGPQGPGFDEKHPFLAKDLPYEQEELKGIGRAAKTMATAPYELLKKTTPEEKAQYPNIVEGGFVNRLANRLIREPIAQEKKAAEASHAAAASGEGTAGQILEYYKNLPFIGGLVSKAMEGGPHMFSPQSIGATTEGAMYVIAPEVQKHVVADLKVRFPQTAEKLRAKSAALYTKSVRPSADLQKTISESDPTAIGKGLQAENIVARRKTYVAKLEPIVDRNVERLRNMEQESEKKGYHMNVQRHFDAAVAEEMKATRNPQAKNTIQQFSDALKYESKFDPATNRWSIDYNKPKNLQYMTPTEIRQFMRDLDEYAYGDASSRALLEGVARKARGQISSEFGKNIPGYTELGKSVQGQIGALDALRETQAAEARGAKTQVMRTVFEAGVVPIATYEALKTLGAGTGIAAGAYPTALTLVKAAVSTPSRTLRAMIYNKLADIIDPKKTAGMTYVNPAPQPVQGAQPPGTASRTTTPQGGAPTPAAPSGVAGAVGGRTAYSGSATPTGEGAGSATTTGATYVRSTKKAVAKAEAAKPSETPTPGVVTPEVQKAAATEAPKAARPKMTDAEKAAARDAKRAKDRDRMAQNRAVAKSEAQQTGMTAWEGEEGKKMRVAVSQAMGPEEHVQFVETAMQRLKQVDPEIYDIAKSLLEGPDKQHLDPATQREMVVNFLEQSVKAAKVKGAAK